MTGPSVMALDREDEITFADRDAMDLVLGLVLAGFTRDDALGIVGFVEWSQETSS